MGSFKYEDYRQPWETGPHWELKREFIEKYQSMFEEDRLLCLAQAYSNVILMNCSYPDPVMRQISELSKPLQMRKRFQESNSSSSAETPRNEQQKVSEKMKSIYGQSGRPFKQIKFCASGSESISSNTSSAAELLLSASEQIESSSNLQIIPQLPSAPVANFQTAANVEKPICQIKGTISAEKEREEEIVTTLGLTLIQNLTEAIRQYQIKIHTATEAISCAVQKLGLRDELCYEIDNDPNSTKHAVLYCSKVMLKKCIIASETGSTKKKAKAASAEAAINFLIKLSTSHLSFSRIEKHVTPKQDVDVQRTSERTKILQKFSKQIAERTTDNSFNGVNYNANDSNCEKPTFILNKKLYNSSLNDGFVLLHKEHFKTCLDRTILVESSGFCHKKYEYQFEDIFGTTSIKAHVLIGGKIVGTAIASGKDEAKILACTEAVKDLRKKYYTLKVNDQYIEGYIITRSQVFDGESFSSNVITDNNIGCKMLKNMGWTGGGLGVSGIAEPVEVNSLQSFGRGLGFGKSEGHNNFILFKKRLEAMLQEFSKTETFSDLVFSKEFSKEERKEIHRLAAKYSLHTHSKGVGDDRYLTIRHKHNSVKLLQFLAKIGGSNGKFELIDASQTSL